MRKPCDILQRKEILSNSCYKPCVAHPLPCNVDVEIHTNIEYIELHKVVSSLIIYIIRAKTACYYTINY